MALNPKDELPHLSGYVDNPELWPPTLPSGVTKDAKVWYAHQRVYRDGSTEWEFRRRGSGGGPGGEGDAVVATVPGAPIKSIKDQYEKDTAAAEKPDPTISAPPTQEFIVGEAPDGSGALTTKPNPNFRPPAGPNEWHPEGTLLPDGTYDNSRPQMVNSKGQRRALTADELRDWNQAGQMTRNPGGKTDAEIKADADKADATARQARLDEEARAQHAAAEGRAQSQEGRAAAAAIPKDTPRAITINGKRVVEHTVAGAPGQPGQVYWTDESGNRIAPPEEGAGPTPAGVRPFVPDPSQDDYGLSTYDEYLQGLRRQGIIDRAQGAELLQRAGSAAQVADTRGQRREQQASTARGQTITEQAGLRSSAGNALTTAYANYAAPIAPEDAGIATNAFLAALRLAQTNAQQWGGMPGPGDRSQESGVRSGMAPAGPLDPDRYTTATQIALHPGGGVEISPPGAPPQGAPAPAGPPVRDDWRSNPGPAPINPPAGEPGNDPTQPVGMGPPPAYMQAMGAGSPQPPPFQPDLAALRAAGFNDAEIQQAWAEHQQEMGA